MHAPVPMQQACHHRHHTCLDFRNAQLTQQQRQRLHLVRQGGRKRGGAGCGRNLHVLWAHAQGAHKLPHDHASQLHKDAGGRAVHVKQPAPARPQFSLHLHDARSSTACMYNAQHDVHQAQKVPEQEAGSSTSGRRSVPDCPGRPSPCPPLETVETGAAAVGCAGPCAATLARDPPEGCWTLRWCAWHCVTLVDAVVVRATSLYLDGATIGKGGSVVGGGVVGSGMVISNRAGMAVRAHTSVSCDVEDAGHHRVTLASHTSLMPSSCNHRSTSSWLLPGVGMSWTPPLWPPLSGGLRSGSSGRLREGASESRAARARTRRALAWYGQGNRGCSVRCGAPWRSSSGACWCVVHLVCATVRGAPAKAC